MKLLERGKNLEIEKKAFKLGTTLGTKNTSVMDQNFKNQKENYKIRSKTFKLGTKLLYCESWFLF